MNSFRKRLFVLLAGGFLLMAFSASASVVTATFNAASDIPVTATSYTATGDTVDFALNFAPATGAKITVIDNTGRDPIDGQFSNLAHGQVVRLVFDGINYNFIANYYGGTGNDLVLEWARNKLYTWGRNDYGQLGRGTVSNRDIPMAIPSSGILSGKTITALGEGNSHSLALCSNGTMLAWGANGVGQLGNGGSANSSVPVAVSTSGILAGRTVVNIAAGYGHNLAVCADGTLVSWGYNNSGQLGIGASGDSSIPVAVTTSAALLGKTVIAVAAGQFHSLALCSDGTLATWGDGSSGQLGNGSTNGSKTPIAINTFGVLAGKKVIAIAAGLTHCLALCQDGTIAAWGANAEGQLGIGAQYRSNIPAAVIATGVLSGRTVTAIAAGGFHSLAICSDGTLAAWGRNDYGQLGKGNSSPTNFPVAVSSSGILSGRTVAGISAGDLHSLALCSDGTLAVWGRNDYDQLGNEAVYSSNLPIGVTPPFLGSGEVITNVAMGAGGDSSMIQVAVPLSSNSALASLTLNSGALYPSFAPGLTNYTASAIHGATSLAVTPVAADANASITVNGKALASGTASLPITLPAETIIIAVTAEDGSVTSYQLAVRGDSTLSGLGIDNGALSPSFSPDTTAYSAYVSPSTASVTITPAATDETSAIKVNGTPAVSGSAGSPVSLAPGANVVTVEVIALDGTSTSYEMLITRQVPLTYQFGSAGSIPLTSTAYVATANSVDLSLGFTPATGTGLTVINNTGSGPIIDRFDNLSQGETIILVHNDINYRFVANYYGGDGNDLVLEWGSKRLLAWGSNYAGQIGNATTKDQLFPMAVADGALAGKPILSWASGSTHNLVAPASGGSLATWGSNDRGQLGTGDTRDRNVPTPAITSGVLAGKTIIELGGGGRHSLAYCTDGTLAAWGSNIVGQLGDGALTDRTLPVLVDRSGVLKGKTIVGLSAGLGHSLALCSDGTMAAWGSNSNGTIGDGTVTDRVTPVQVNNTGVLSGKKVIAIASGSSFNLALCSDGTLAAWGQNFGGQLGDGSTTYRITPVLVNRSGVLSGKTVTAIACGGDNCLVLCSDGTLAAWGANQYGQLGTGFTTSSTAPVLVKRTGVLSSKTVTAIAAGDYHCVVLCSDGTMVAWGSGSSGQIGDGSASQRELPVLVSTSGLRTGERFASVTSGGAHNLAIVASPPSPLPVATNTGATFITGTTAVLNGIVNASGTSADVSFEYGNTASYGNSVAANPTTLTGTTSTPVFKGIIGLIPGTVYHFRLVAAGTGGTARSADMTFTTLSDNANLSSLVSSTGSLSPSFNKDATSYITTVAFTTDHVTVTASKAHPRASLKVNAGSVPSGVASAPIPLAMGNTTVNVDVTAEDGITTKTYTITVTQLPEHFTFDSATSIPVTAEGFSTSGYPVDFVLNYPPVPGTILTAVNNTGLAFIEGSFGNLAQGQHVSLTYGGVSYDFVANYFGGDGNDLVLQWATTQVYAWGANNYGQLGDGSNILRTAPVVTDGSGILANKTIVSLAGGYLHSLALCSDGTLGSWGYNVYGQLGNGGSVESSVPVEVDQSGALAGKTVIAISAGPFHNLALCSDGSIAAWGYNNYGQLGTGDKVTCRVPTLVNPVGALAGKQVVGIAAGAYQSFALCADGSVVAWGYNDEGELGNNSTTSRLVPVAVDTSGDLANKKVASISAGQYHTLALCTDGTLFGWGYNQHGELGNNSTTSSSVPVAIGSFGILAGKTVSSIAAGSSHSLALCKDGTLAAWGSNEKFQLGTTSVGQSLIPIEVSPAGVTLGKSIFKITAGAADSMALCSDGSLAVWGDNSKGQLGNNSTTTSEVPSIVDSSSMALGSRFMSAVTGSASLHSLAIVGIPAPISDAQKVQEPASDHLTPLGDDDHDGIPNLVERAFGLNSTKDSSGELPQPHRIGDNYVIEFTEPQGLTNITYGAESSVSLKAGSWVDVPDSGSGAHHIFSVPADDGKSIFFRLKVTE